MTSTLRGLWPAMLTPLDEAGNIDTARAARQARRMLDCGSQGVTLFGTTGEGPAFTVSERKALLQAMVDAGIQPGRLIVGAAACAQPDAVELSRQATQLGCAAVLYFPPFYFDHPGDAGVVSSVSDLIAQVGDARLRVMLYHIPQLTRIAFSIEAVSELARLYPQQLVGVKDSTGDRLHSLKLVQTFPQLGVFVGNELDVERTMRAGGAGTVCGLANIAPRLLARITAAGTTGQPVAGQDQDAMEQLLGLIGTDHFLPVFKTVMAEQLADTGWLRMRLPMTPLEAAPAKHVVERYRAIAQAFPGL
jgi:4-hydroxy-tetrahydrodipicolinate synthase